MSQFILKQKTAGEPREREACRFCMWTICKVTLDRNEIMCDNILDVIDL